MNDLPDKSVFLSRKSRIVGGKGKRETGQDMASASLPGKPHHGRAEACRAVSHAKAGQVGFPGLGKIFRDFDAEKEALIPGVLIDVLVVRQSLPDSVTTPSASSALSSRT